MEKLILFKGRRVDNNEWVEGFLFNSNAIIPLDATYMQTSLGDVVKGIKEVVTETVSQFINHFDKNNEKIFENDVVIVSCNSNSEKLGPAKGEWKTYVKYDQVKCKYVLVCFGKKHLIWEFDHTDFNGSIFKKTVIGNTYDTLKEKLGQNEQTN